MIDLMLDGATLRLAGRDNEDALESLVFAIPEPSDEEKQTTAGQVSVDLVGINRLVNVTESRIVGILSEETA